MRLRDVVSLLLVVVAVISAPSRAEAEDLQVEIKLVGIEGNSLPGTTIKVVGRGPDGSVVFEKTSTARSDGRAFMVVPEKLQLTVSADTRGMIPVTLGPIVTQVGLALRLQICMNYQPLLIQLN